MKRRPSFLVSCRLSGPRNKVTAGMLRRPTSYPTDREENMRSAALPQVPPSPNAMWGQTNPENINFFSPPSLVLRGALYHERCRQQHPARLLVPQPCRHRIPGRLLLSPGPPLLFQLRFHSLKLPPELHHLLRRLRRGLVRQVRFGLGEGALELLGDRRLWVRVNEQDVAGQVFRLVLQKGRMPLFRGVAQAKCRGK